MCVKHNLLVYSMEIEKKPKGKDIYIVMIINHKSIRILESTFKNI